jgi:type II secretory pathway pseudopilin PulG
LIELLVVITMLAFLAALTALFFPRFQERQQVEIGASRLSSWLLIAKQMAKRDGLPTGLRLSGAVATGADGPSTFYYIQQPDDFAQGVYTGPYTNPTTHQVNPLVAQFDATAHAALTKVQGGDYLEIYGGGPPRRLVTPTPTQLAANQLPLDPNSTPLPNVTATQTTASATNYRIIPQPRVLTGEPMLNLPTDVIVDTSTFPAPNSTRNHSRLPGGTSAAGTPGADILFAPSGAVIGSGAASPGYYYFYIRDDGQETHRKIHSQGKLFEGNPRLVAVYPRTGFIATQPVNPDPANHDLFLKDGRASGM